MAVQKMHGSLGINLVVQEKPGTLEKAWYFRIAAVGGGWRRAAGGGGGREAAAGGGGRRRRAAGIYLFISPTVPSRYQWSVSNADRA